MLENRAFTAISPIKKNTLRNPNHIVVVLVSIIDVFTGIVQISFKGCFCGLYYMRVILDT